MPTNLARSSLRYPQISTPCCGWPVRPCMRGFGSASTRAKSSRALRSKSCQSLGLGSRTFKSDDIAVLAVAANRSQLHLRLSQLQRLLVVSILHHGAVPAAPKRDQEWGWKHIYEKIGGSSEVLIVG